MVGGIIIDVVTVDSQQVWVETEERVFDPKAGTYTPRGRCGLYVNPGGHKLKRGDSLWWQGASAFWTPKPERGGMHDVELARIGFSGAPRPEARA